MHNVSFDPLTYAIGAFEGAEATAGHMLGGRSLDASRTVEDAWHAVVSTRATDALGMVWKIGRAWEFYVGEGPDWVMHSLDDIAGRAAAGEPVARALARLADCLGEGAYPDLIKSAVADAEKLESRQ